MDGPEFELRQEQEIYLSNDQTVYGAYLPSCSVHEAIRIEARTGTEGLQEAEAPRIYRQSALEGGKVVSPTELPPLPHPPGSISSTHYS